jgi:hypothetical protein
MTEDLMRYDLLVEGALRRVVRQTLARVLADGLPGDHHLYITFATKAANVVLPIYLHEKFPSEMTIVLQHQYRNLAVGEDGFSVSLSFNNVDELLRIPFAAIRAFADPSVNFSLQFRPDGVIAPVDAGDSSGAVTGDSTAAVTGDSSDAAAGDSADAATGDSTDAAAGDSSDAAAAGTTDAAAGDNIVTLDTFRKK